MQQQRVSEPPKTNVKKSSNFSFQHGAILTNKGTQFSLWAPNSSTVDVKFKDGQTYSLDAAGEGWFTKTISTRDCTYRFVIDGDLEVPDPASRAQINDITGWSRVVDHSLYKWRADEWRGRPWHETVFYELHVGTLGGFVAVEALLPELAELGITAIELMPLNEFPGERNWGYDGTLPFAPDSAYGTPEQLKSLIDTAHSLDLMVFIDVVYNHFGPVGNYLGEYAKEFFREDIHTPWGAAIDFRKPQVRNFFYENAVMWIRDYRVDGLRFDAVHAINDKDFLIELAKQARAAASDRHVHLVVENEDNSAALLEQGFNAQWNDDAHNILHTLLTGEQESYYANYKDSQTQKLARYLSDGFIYQGEKSHNGRNRGEPSGHLPPTSFIVFLQNHDQIGNRAFGERLIELTDVDSLKVATALVLLSPMIPLLFMGEEYGSRQPFLYFTDHPPEIAEMVRNGRREKFADFSEFKDEKMREKIPDPNNLNSFIRSIVHNNSFNKSEWRSFYKNLLKLRRTEIIPRLTYAKCERVTIVAELALIVSWTVADGHMLDIAINLSKSATGSITNQAEGKSIFSYGYENYSHKNKLPASSINVALR